MVPMEFFDWINSKIRRFNWTDLAFVELSSISFGLLLATLIPSLVTVNSWVFLVLWILLAMKPISKATG
ncbi:MAG: hypothetical protein R6U62_10015 [Bacteroidales bacterium]